jgi:hypothetical protein
MYLCAKKLLKTKRAATSDIITGRCALFQHVSITSGAKFYFGQTHIHTYFSCSDPSVHYPNKNLTLHSFHSIVMA